MTDRDRDLTSIRIQLSQAKVFESTNALERFQNETLRPIAKFQNTLLLELFKSYIIRYKKVFHKNDVSGKLSYIEQAVKKDSKLKNVIRGLFLGHFTIEEYNFYTEHKSSVNRRITNLVKERLQSQLQYFD